MLSFLYYYSFLSVCTFKFLQKISGNKSDEMKDAATKQLMNFYDNTIKDMNRIGAETISSVSGVIFTKIGGSGACKFFKNRCKTLAGGKTEIKGYCGYVSVFQ